MKNDIKTGVILLAGRGSRLEELTDYKPKPLVEVNNSPIIHRILDELALLNIKKMILVVGYLSEQIRDYVGEEWKGMDIEYVYNEKWDQTNNIVSFYMALDKIETNFMLLEGDIIVSENALKSFDKLNMMAVDEFKDYMDGTVVQLDDNNEVVEKFYLKSTPGRPEDLTGYFKTVNIYSFDKNKFMDSIYPYLEELVEEENKINSYYELAFAKAVNSGDIELEGLNFHDKKWAEIDDQKDLQYAEKLFSETIL